MERRWMTREERAAASEARIATAIAAIYDACASQIAIGSETIVDLRNTGLTNVELKQALEHAAKRMDLSTIKTILLAGNKIHITPRYLRSVLGTELLVDLQSDEYLHPSISGQLPTTPPDPDPKQPEARRTH